MDAKLKNEIEDKVNDLSEFCFKNNLSMIVAVDDDSNMGFYRAHNFVKPEDFTLLVSNFILNICQKSGVDAETFFEMFGKINARACRQLKEEHTTTKMVH